MPRTLYNLTLRSSLLLDAAVSGATGVLMLAAAGPLGDLLDLPTTLLRVAGLILIPYVALLVIFDPVPDCSGVRLDRDRNKSALDGGQLHPAPERQGRSQRPRHRLRHLPGRRRPLRRAAVRDAEPTPTCGHNACRPCMTSEASSAAER